MVQPLDGFFKGLEIFTNMALGLCVKQPLHIRKLNASFSFKNYMHIRIVIISVVQHMSAPITIATLNCFDLLEEQ
jgi:hypothetical protein